MNELEMMLWGGSNAETPQMSLNNAGITIPKTNDFWSMESAFGGENPWASTALDSIDSLLGGWMALQQYGLAKDQFNFQKKAFNTNYNAQVQQYNTNLEDRQDRRNRWAAAIGQPGTVQDTAGYMAEHALNWGGGGASPAQPAPTPTPMNNTRPAAQPAPSWRDEGRFA